MNRRSAARAVAIGLFCGLIPGPLQALAAVVACLVIRANFPIAVVTTFYTNPFTIVPLYVIAYEYGRLFFPNAPPSVAWSLPPSSGLARLDARAAPLDGATRQAARRRPRDARGDARDRRLGERPARVALPRRVGVAPARAAARARLARDEAPVLGRGRRDAGRRRCRCCAGLIAPCPDVHLARRGDPFTTLARAIVGQQISVKAAQSIWDRLVAATGGGGTPVALDPARVGRTRMPTLRRVGLSERKALYVRDLARHFVSGALDPREWPALPDEDTHRAAVRRQGHRPLDGRDVPDLPRAASRRASRRRHRVAEGRRRPLPRRRAHAARSAAHVRRALVALAQRRDVVPVALARPDSRRVLTEQTGVDRIAARNGGEARV